MLNTAIIEIRTRGLGVDSTKNKVEWTREQLWETMVKLAEEPQISYDRLLFNVFNSNENAIRALVHNDIIAVDRVVDSASYVTPSSPLYKHAFIQMARDPQLRKGMQTLVKKAKTEELNKKIREIEEELTKLHHLKTSEFVLLLFGFGLGITSEIKDVHRRRRALETELGKLNAQVVKLETELK